MKRVKLGDIIEIPTHRGFGYAQYTNRHPTYGELIRVFAGLHATASLRASAIVSEDVQFVCFFPLQAALRQGLVRVVCNVGIPQHLAEFPVFRTGLPDPHTGKVDLWWLWDGEREWQVERLSAKERGYPPRGIWNDTLLAERIDCQWKAEDDETL